MKDENGIEICCENCDDFIPVGTNGRGCALYEEDCDNVFGEKRCIFKASSEALEARIADLEKKLTETVKLLGERSRECGKLQALLEVKNRSNMSTQSTDAEDVSKKIRETDMSNIWWR